MIEIHLVLIFMIASAVIAVEMEDLLSSVIAVGAAGIGLSMAFLVLKAPDLAITQLVVEILSLIILIRATARKDLPNSRSGRWLFNTISTLVFLVIFLGTAYLALRDIPEFGYPDMRTAKLYIDEAIRNTPGENIVSTLVLKFRSFDTLGEVAVLFTAVAGILAVARKVGRNQ